LLRKTHIAVSPFPCQIEAGFLELKEGSESHTSNERKAQMKLILAALLLSISSVVYAFPTLRVPSFFNTTPPQLHYDALREWYSNGAEVSFEDRKGLFVGRCYPMTGMGLQNSILWAFESKHSDNPARASRYMWTMSTSCCNDTLDTRSAADLKRTLTSKFGQTLNELTNGQVHRNSPLTTTIQESGYSMDVHLREYGRFLVELDVYRGPSARVRMRTRTLTLNDGDVAFACYYSIKK
jgi:hypothetical protein